MSQEPEALTPRITAKRIEQAGESSLASQ